MGIAITGVFLFCVEHRAREIPHYRGFARRAKKDSVEKNTKDGERGCFAKRGKIPHAPLRAT